MAGLEQAEHLEVLLEPLGKHVRSYYGNQGGGTLPKDTSVAVCTIEKANSLINRFLEEGRLLELRIIVIDELHMVGDQNRGYLGESSGTSSGKTDPARGLQIIVLDDLSRAREGFVLASDLHLVYLVTPTNVEVEPDWKLYYERFMQLSTLDQAMKVLGASPSAYSANPKSKLSNPPSLTGSAISLVSVVQARNNARIMIAGFLDMFNCSNQVCRRLGAQIILTCILDLRAVNVRHHKVGEIDEPAIYRINDDLEYSIEIFEWSGTNWEPYVSNDVQVQFYMMSPYVLKTLSTNQKS
ncbi:unnamed protein product [Camellia sinensis]